MEYILFGKVYKVYTYTGEYANNNNIAIGLITEDGEPFATLTVNICRLEKGLACIDTNNCSGAIDLIKKYNLGEFTNNFCQSGYCTYPVFKLNMDNINKYAYKGVN